MTHIQTGPGQSFSISLASPPPPPAASPASTSTTVLDSPHPYHSAHYRRASQGPSVLGTPTSATWDIDRYDTQSALIASLNRSATVVFWYQANVQPLRLHQEIPTFPLFSFNSLTEIVEQLRLSEKTYLDSYDPRTGTWEQQQLSVVRRIESEQRLLYRVRRGLFEALRDEECPGLDVEIKLQEEERSTRMDASLSTNARKRPADQPLGSPVGKHHRSASMQSFSSSYTAGSPPSNGGSVLPPSTNLASLALNVSPLSSDAGACSPYAADQGSLSGALGSPQRPSTALQSPSSLSLSTKSVEPPTHHTQISATPNNIPSPSIGRNVPPNAATTPQSPLPPPPVPTITLPLAALPQPHGLPRKWPNDFFVYEIAAGLRDMERLAAAEPALKQDEVFRRAFGLAYVKSTFCRHRALWRAAGAPAQREFEEMGRDPRACWGEFARRMEGREDGGRRARARRGPGGAGKVGGEEADEEGQARERMMSVIGMPLPMIMSSLPAQGVQGGEMGGAGSGARAASDAGGLPTGRQGNEEPVMGSLRPPEEAQAQQRHA